MNEAVFFFYKAISTEGWGRGDGTVGGEQFDSNTGSEGYDFWAWE